MKQMIAPLVLCLALSPALAQEVAPPPAAEEDGLSLMERGAKLLFRGLMSEMEPALDGMAEAMAEMKPAVQALAAMIDDLQNYHAPEKLPNGDIIIRRKLPTEIAPVVPRGPEVDL
ncbi:AAA+ family ATPase [Paracoccaceae bacterium Fryx2]|nr:AAA+ family ATPase [Paracoccaceae bacterium Fryx2]